MHPLWSLLIASTINTMRLWSPIFLLDCYCSSCNKNRRIFLSIFTLIIFSIGGPVMSYDTGHHYLALMGFLFIWGDRPLIGLLNSMVAGFRRPAPISIKCICNKAKCIFLLMSRHFNGMLNKFYTCFHLSIPLVVL